MPTPDEGVDVTPRERHLASLGRRRVKEDGVLSALLGMQMLAGVDGVIDAADVVALARGVARAMDDDRGEPEEAQADLLHGDGASP